MFVAYLVPVHDFVAADGLGFLAVAPTKEAAVEALRRQWCENGMAESHPLFTKEEWAAMVEEDRLDRIAGWTEIVAEGEEAEHVLHVVEA